MPQGGSFLPLQEFSDVYAVKNDIPNSLDDGTGLSRSEKKRVRSLVNVQEWTEALSARLDSLEYNLHNDIGRHLDARLNES